jgi:hypothetical protein
VYSCTPILSKPQRRLFNRFRDRCRQYRCTEERGREYANLHVRLHQRMSRRLLLVRSEQNFFTGVQQTCYIVSLNICLAELGESIGFRFILLFSRTSLFDLLKKTAIQSNALLKYQGFPLFQYQKGDHPLHPPSAMISYKKDESSRTPQER